MALVIELLKKHLDKITDETINALNARIVEQKLSGSSEQQKDLKAELAKLRTDLENISAQLYANRDLDTGGLQVICGRRQEQVCRLQHAFEQPKSIDDRYT